MGNRYAWDMRSLDRDVRLINIKLKMVSGTMELVPENNHTVKEFIDDGAGSVEIQLQDKWYAVMGFIGNMYGEGGTVSLKEHTIPEDGKLTIETSPGGSLGAIADDTEVWLNIFVKNSSVK